MPKSRVLDVGNISFNVIRENKIIAKISEFTVSFNTIKVKKFSPPLS